MYMHIHIHMHMHIHMHIRILVKGHLRARPSGGPAGAAPWGQKTQQYIIHTYYNIEHYILYYMLL